MCIRDSPNTVDGSSAWPAAKFSGLSHGFITIIKNSNYLIIKLVSHLSIMLYVAGMGNETVVWLTRVIAFIYYVKRCVVQKL